MNLDTTKLPHQLAADFLEAVKTSISSRTPSADAIPMLQASPAQKALIDAAILAEFDGVNYAELAQRYRVSLQWVFQLVKLSRLQSVSLALRQVVGIEPEIVWVGHMGTAEPLQTIEAGIQAFEMTKARLQAEAHDPAPSPPTHRLLVAIALLPLTHPVVLAANARGAAATEQAETPPDTPAPAGSPPAPLEPQ